MPDYRSVLNGILFSEGGLPGTDLGPVAVEISRQNSNVGVLKERLAEQARALGANAVAHYEYGQKAHRGLKLLALKWDTESWHGVGRAMLVDPSEFPSP